MRLLLGFAQALRESEDVPESQVPQPRVGHAETGEELREEERCTKKRGNNY